MHLAVDHILEEKILYQIVAAIPETKEWLPYITFDYSLNTVDIILDQIPTALAKRIMETFKS